MSSATITSKGRITIPKAVRQRLALRQGVRVAFVVEADHAVMHLVVPQRALPNGGFGMIKVDAVAVPADFDVAALLTKGRPRKPLKASKRSAPR
jgi:AbrB family looped-hinge helix DNA binding protein